MAPIAADATSCSYSIGPGGTHWVLELRRKIPFRPPHAHLQRVSVRSRPLSPQRPARVTERSRARPFVPRPRQHRRRARRRYGLRISLRRAGRCHGGGAGGARPSAAGTKSTASRPRRSNASPCGCGTGCRTACRAWSKSRSPAIAAARAPSIRGPIAVASCCGVSHGQEGHHRHASRAGDEAAAKPAKRRPSTASRTRTLTRLTWRASRRPEFTSLCPITGQPDFAHLVIDYVPRATAGGIEVAEALPRFVPQPRRLPRGLHAGDRQAPGPVAGAALPPHRRLLVPPRRHPDRCVLADRPAPKGVWLPDQGVPPNTAAAAEVPLAFQRGWRLAWHRQCMHEGMQLNH